MQAIKNFFVRMGNIVRVLITLSILGVTFYGGMYFVSSQYEENPQNVMMSAVKRAVSDTSEQPIIVIAPKNSVIENARAAFGYEMTREVVVIETTHPTVVLAENMEPGFVSRAMSATGSAFVTAGNGIKSGALWCWDKVSFWN